ncbi:AlpA family transcriptional regulator [Dyella sp. SG562]|uniref:helix-turn-helix transcriptional regulator n=1 Tax=Dyella sp. SG562 TaxID=2587017 RepID=UPI001420EBB3|nr:AlpA family transcriptional regulator [Dyella sp. SG562]
MESIPVPIRFLRLPDVLSRTRLSRSQIYRLETAGRFPGHVKLGDAVSAWVESEVDQWCADRIAASRGAVA